GIARDAGADACLIITPYYARPTQEALYQWYATVAREYPDLPLVIYNVPGRAAVDIAPETVGRLYRDFDNLVGIKETTKDFEHFSRVIADRLHPLVDVTFVETNPALAKWVLAQRGLISSPYVRPPLITPTEPGQDRIKQLLAQ